MLDSHNRVAARVMLGMDSHDVMEEQLQESKSFAISFSGL